MQNMKRILLFLLLFVTATEMLLAQKGLAIADQFDGSKSYFSTATRVWVEGQELKRYHLTLYKSITVKDNFEATLDMERAVLADARNAVSKEMGHLCGRLYYAFLGLNGTNSTNRYIFYRNHNLVEGGKNEVTLVYMEGQISMQELKDMFMKKSHK